MNVVYFETNYRNGFIFWHVWKLKITKCHLTQEIRLSLLLWYLTVLIVIWFISIWEHYTDLITIFWKKEIKQILNRIKTKLTMTVDIFKIKISINITFFH